LYQASNLNLSNRLETRWGQSKNDHRCYKIQATQSGSLV
jgi:hypothetical protein